METHRGFPVVKGSSMNLTKEAASRVSLYSSNVVVGGCMTKLNKVVCPFAAHDSASDKI